MNRIAPIMLILMLALINGCSSDKNNENAFQTQIDAVDKAGEVEAKILEAASRQQEAIDEAGQ